MPELVEKVDRLEEMMMRIAYAQMNTQIQLDSLSREMKDFKNEMKDFKNEMKDFKNEMKDFKNEMKDFKNEMKDFKDKTDANLDSLSKDIKESNRNANKKYEELVKKLGTLAEDMVAPNVDFLAKKYFNCSQCLDFMVRRRKVMPEDPAKGKEFDVLALYEDIIILVEAKHNPKPEYASEFIEFIHTKEFVKYFPEYENKKLIPIFASFYIPDNVLIQLSKNKIYAMATKEDTMDIINFDDVNT